MKYISVRQIEEGGAAHCLFTSGGSGYWPYDDIAGTDNYKELAREYGTDPEHMIRVDQKHTDRILKAELYSAGSGVVRAGEEGPCDGIITDVPGLMLCIVTADCVPVSILDPVKRAAGIVHSGWKGTAAEISARAVEAMAAEYGTDPADLIVCLGPYICQDCYEVSDDLKDVFSENFSADETAKIFRAGRTGHSYMDLGGAIRLSLEKAGVKSDRIHDPHLCTYHSEERFFSWRRDHTKGKNVLSAIMLKEGSEQDQK